MRKNYLFVVIAISLILVGCNGIKDSSADENREPEILSPSRPTYTIKQLVEEADIIANLTVTELVDVIEIHEEAMTFEYSMYKATVNHYLYNGLDYDTEINFLHVGGPNWRLSDDPLLEIGETYILFLDNREDPDVGTNLVITGGPQGRYNKVDDGFVRQLHISSDKGLSRPSEEELIEALNERSDELNIDLSILN